MTQTRAESLQRDACNDASRDAALSSSVIHRHLSDVTFIYVKEVLRNREGSEENEMSFLLKKKKCSSSLVG